MKHLPASDLQNPILWNYLSVSATPVGYKVDLDSQSLNWPALTRLLRFDLSIKLKYNQSSLQLRYFEDMQVHIAWRSSSSIMLTCIFCKLERLRIWKNFEALPQSARCTKQRCLVVLSSGAAYCEISWFMVMESIVKWKHEPKALYFNACSIDEKCLFYIHEH